MITGELKSKIDAIWTTFWTGGVTNTITIVEQLTYLIFIKDLDETEVRNELKARHGFKYTPIFSPEQQKFRWKNLKEMDVTARHEIFTNTVDGIFPFIRSLGKETSLFATHMKGATFGISKASVLDQVMEKLENIDMSNQDTKGDIVAFPKNRTVLNSNLLILNFNCHNEEKQFYREPNFKGFKVKSASNFC